MMTPGDVLFVWVPKAAGTSIYHVLQRHGCPENLWERPERPFANQGLATFGHVSVPALVEHGTLRRDFLDTAFKFAFVRNPYDRLVSLFFYLRRIGNPIAIACPSFREFCLRLDAEPVPPVGFYNYFTLNQCNPMVRWLYDEAGNCLVDFIGRVENLAADWQAVCHRVGFAESLGSANSTPHRPYRDYYSSDCRRVVERLYAEDLDRFGYAF